jgi:peptidoglycan/xylan/chitin deacetylase (PgdA/CDA1 family)
MSMVNGTQLQAEIEHVFPQNSKRLAVVTCDIEPDFGGRTQATELIDDRIYLDKLVSFCESQNVPLSAFIVTALLQGDFAVLQSIKDHTVDVHAHSHTHDTSKYREQSAKEVQTSQKVFTEYFGHPSLGYRAPQGVLTQKDISALESSGFVFDSSIFPARRLEVFDYRSLPREPWRWKGGVIEMPFASSASHQRITLSMLKLWGINRWKNILKNKDEIPSMFVIDTHLHDFFVPQHFSHLPLLYRLAYSRNKTKGFEYISELIALLKSHSYEFITMTQAYEQLAANR